MNNKKRIRHMNKSNCIINKQKRANSSRVLLKRRRLICGFGINDLESPIRADGVLLNSYRVWYSMIERCYRERRLKKHHTYIGCSVCNEWKYFSAFKDWYDNNYVEGYALDKDIIIQNNKIYSPSTCCFVPRKINIMMAERGDSLHTGVNIKRAGVGGCAKDSFFVKMKVNGKHVKIGSFSNLKDAKDAYSKARDKRVQDVAIQAYQDNQITKLVFDALMAYRHANRTDNKDVIFLLKEE